MPPRGNHVADPWPPPASKSDLCRYARPGPPSIPARLPWSSIPTSDHPTQPITCATTQVEENFAHWTEPQRREHMDMKWRVRLYKAFGGETFFKILIALGHVDQEVIELYNDSLRASIWEKAGRYAGERARADPVLSKRTYEATPSLYCCRSVPPRRTAKRHVATALPPRGTTSPPHCHRVATTTSPSRCHRLAISSPPGQ